MKQIIVSVKAVRRNGHLFLRHTDTAFQHRQIPDITQPSLQLGYSALHLPEPVNGSVKLQLMGIGIVYTLVGQFLYQKLLIHLPAHIRLADIPLLFSGTITHIIAIHIQKASRISGIIVLIALQSFRRCTGNPQMLIHPRHLCLFPWHQHAIILFLSHLLYGSLVCCHKTLLSFCKLHSTETVIRIIV